MTQSKHTQGPWAVKRLGDAKTTAFDVIDSNGRNVLLNDQDEANARLIAAAPELLAALELAEKVILKITTDAIRASATWQELESVDREPLKRIRAAIAKATGVGINLDTPAFDWADSRLTPEQ